jgi:NDP-sugar pyrophosphorylase family protein
VPDVPKALAPIAGKPFLEYQVMWVRDQGFTDLVFCVGYLSDHVRSYFGNGDAWGVRIDYAVEPHLLGTGGAILNARQFVDDTFLVLNGDTYLEVDLRSIVASHELGRDSEPLIVGTLAAIRINDARDSGALAIDSASRIVSFTEKQAHGPGWVNGGAYVLETCILDAIPNERPVSIEREIFPSVIQQGYSLNAHQLDGFFADIGTPAGYRRFCQYAEEHLR